ncbi:MULTISPECIES: HpcH/HpaI aldolase/citrate lyase family protein [Mycobacterium]|uniref:Citrate lyase subunit beta n=1 Tax=Mycobacterium kiyosense TaxID=2871094 RepID=A0A9P3Q3G2_9MYCO|nr:MULTISPECIES: CoA ester lyase [Mycobacterium]BDB41282.1 citrate lyase subunit beta [Mycobacterium kiyosense]BDE13037.1 citrate lyase subunit beta [Mycobacterium sp. 20KCMC460]GLB81995.1 citrate lyase subunit beta [Mycobacterium kiyosense]GLB89506.1 citrate lyase subunit beta [Mycobacterium kiyosense]GLB95137.1 citrate lyase subunit beta [Mycobacterium kiyosense]
MAPTLRPRRSALYLPGNNARALEKGKSLPADVLIFDLEDAVGPDAKADSRRRVCDAVASRAYRPREIVVRINGLDTEWHDDDLAAVADSVADGVLVPKVETGQKVRALADRLDGLGAPESLQLWVMVETPRAFLRMEEVASASERLAALVVGTNDLVNELHALHVPGRASVVPALALAVLGARAAGKVVLDGVFNAIKDEDGFRTEAQQGREMGFDGKTLIHPSQVGPANEIFGPSQGELAHANKVVEAYEQAQAAGESVITVDGRMIESLHVRDAQRILALAERIAELGSQTQ